jgi:hypothetical protein
MRDTVIVDAIRTSIRKGKPTGALAGDPVGSISRWSAPQIPDICYGSNYAASCLFRYSLWTSLGVR